MAQIPVRRFAPRLLEPSRNSETGPTADGFRVPVADQGCVTLSGPSKRGAVRQRSKIVTYRRGSSSPEPMSFPWPDNLYLVRIRKRPEGATSPVTTPGGT